LTEVKRWMRTGIQGSTARHFRDNPRKRQRSIGFVVAWGSAYVSAWALIRPLAWFAGEQRDWLFEGVQISAQMVISLTVVIYVIRSLIVNRRRPRDERQRYPPVSSDQVVDLYLRFMVTAAGTAVVTILGLLGLQRLRWLYSGYSLIVIAISCTAGGIVWIVAGRSLRPYPMD
jgi:hypothetical protein